MNLDDIKPIIQEKSDINIFNTIGELAKYNNFEVEYFKEAFLVPNKENVENIINDYNNDKNINTLINSLKVSNYVHYIHIIKEEDIFISIYYDDSSTLAQINSPYYELYSKSNVDRYNPKNELKLYNDVKKLIIKE